MEQFHQNKKIENALIPSMEHEYDPMKLQRLTLYYADMVDATGKHWIIQFKNDEWTDEIREEAGTEVDVPSPKMEFKNKEDAFLYLKPLVFKKEMQESIVIAKEHGLDTKVYEEVIDQLTQAENELDENKKKQFITGAFRLAEKEL